MIKKKKNKNRIDWIEKNRKKRKIEKVLLNKIVQLKKNIKKKKIIRKNQKILIRIIIQFKKNIKKKKYQKNKTKKNKEKKIQRNIKIQQKIANLVKI